MIMKDLGRRNLVKPGELFIINKQTRLRDLKEFLNSDQISEADLDSYMSFWWFKEIVIRLVDGKIILDVFGEDDE